MNNFTFIVFLSLIWLAPLSAHIYFKQTAVVNPVPPLAQYHGIWREDCAPWDGSAVTISVSEKEISCNTERLPYLEIRIYESESEISGKTFSFPNKLDIGSIAEVTTANNQKKFIQIKRGTVKFEEAAKTSNISGKFDVEFEDGKNMSGAFTAKKCEHQVLCG